MVSTQITRVAPANRHGAEIGPAVTNILPLHTYQWSKEDISDAEAGRSTALHMIKMLQGKARVLNLGWKNYSYSETAPTLQAFDHEYANITYIDALTGTLLKKHFYMSNMTANSYSATDEGMWEMVTVRCIQAQVDKVTPT